MFQISDTNNNDDDDFYLIRRYSERNKNTFVHNLNAIDWNEVLPNSNAQLAFSTFHSLIKKEYDTNFPLIKVKRQYNNKKPWLTNCLRKSIRQKKLDIKAKARPTLNNEITYKRYKNKLLKILKQAEKLHYQELFGKYRTNLKKTWQIIKVLINKQRSISLQKKFKFGDEIITNSQQICEKFNDFFINIGPNLNKDIPCQNKLAVDYVEKIPESIFLNPVDENEVEAMINNLKESSPGWDAISPKLLKHILPSILKPMVRILNISLEEGVFPDEMKIARVLPLYKSDDPMIANHYRPVSILPAFSKLFEQTMYTRLLNFHMKHKLLYEYQFGLRHNHSVYMSLIILIDKIITSLNNGDYTIGLFLDFKKAFDTINHDILINKLEMYGIGGTANKWIESYLTDRYQFEEYDRVSSSKKKIICGVPQGSILGPLSFFIYINDLAKILTKLFTLMFADDTRIFISGSDLYMMEKTLNDEMKKVDTWLKVNKLSLNISKTQFMLFKGNKTAHYYPKISVDSKYITQVKWN